MPILQHTEFKNKHGDKVDVRLISSERTSAYEVITNIEMSRRDTEKRFHKGQIVELSVYKWTHEVTVNTTNVERTAIVEYNMARTLQGDPTLTMPEFQTWLTEFDTEKENNS